MNEVQVSTVKAKIRAPSFEGVPDSRLVELTLTGDHAAFEAIMRRNNRRLFRIARGILGVDADAEDAVQESYVNAYVHLAQFEGRAKLSTWLSRMVVNESLGMIRRRKSAGFAAPDNRTAPQAQDNIVNLHGDDGPGPEEQVANRQLKSMMEQAIDRLPENFRTVFLLREVEGMSVSDIAETLDIPEATVKTRNFRARKQLRKDFEERLEPAMRDAFLFLGARCDRLVGRVLAKLQEIGVMKR